MAIGNVIRKARYKKGYTHDNMALMLNMSQNGYCKIENDKVCAKVDTLVKISQILQVSIIELIEPILVVNVCDRDKRIALSTDVPNCGTSANERRLYDEILRSKNAEIYSLRGLVEMKDQLLMRCDQEIETLKSKVLTLPN